MKSVFYSFVIISALVISTACSKEQVAEAGPDEIPKNIEAKVERETQITPIETSAASKIKGTFCFHVTMVNKLNGSTALDGDYGCVERTVSFNGVCSPDNYEGVNAEEGLALLQELAHSNSVLAAVLAGDGYSTEAPGVWGKDIGDFHTQVFAYRVASAVCE